MDDGTIRLRLLLGMAALLASALSARGATPAPGYVDSAFVTGLSGPTAIVFLPDGRLIITEKGGFGESADAPVKLFDGNGTTTLGTIPVCTGSEMGLLGAAIDAGFAANGFIYLYRTESAGGCGSASGRSNEVVRVTMSGASIGSLAVLLTGMRTDNGNHDGGGVRYNPADGKLYVGVGDTGFGDNQGCPGSSTNPYAQDLNALEGKLLRLNLDGTVPGDNPFFGQAGKRGEIFAYGLRNPFRFSFDPITGRLWLGDVGDAAFEEVDIVSAGGNYAFPRCEGPRPIGCQLAGDIDPIFSYAHTAGCGGEAPFLGSSITGGSFAGAAFGAHAGHYVFGDYTGSAVYRLEPNPARTGVVGAADTIVSNAGGPVDFMTGPDGAIYYAAFDAGDIRRLAFVGAPSTTTSVSTTTTTTLPPTTDERLTGRRLALKVSGARTPADGRLSVISRDASVTVGGNGTADDPTLHGGSLHVRTAAGCSAGPCDATYSLPRGSWRRLGATGYRFKSRRGPIALVVVKARKLVKVIGTGALGLELQAAPGAIDVVPQTGARRYCIRFGGTTAFRRAQFTAKDAPVSPGCPP